MGLAYRPTDYSKWGALISRMAKHLHARYPTKEIMFEVSPSCCCCRRAHAGGCRGPPPVHAHRRCTVAQVWNEPNGGFWHPGPLGSQQDTYFRLYQETANALKSVSAENFKVGGPATAGCPGWTAELVAFAHANHTALDFITCHN